MAIIFIGLLLLAFIALVFLEKRQQTRNSPKTNTLRDRSASVSDLACQINASAQNIETVDLSPIYVLPKGKFDWLNILYRGIEGFGKDDVPFLSAEEFESFNRLGDAAVENFSPTSRLKYRKFEKEKRDISAYKRVYKSAYHDHLCDLLDELDKRFDNLIGSPVSFYYSKKNLGIDVWRQSIYMRKNTLKQRGFGSCTVICYQWFAMCL
ncbi:MAG: hypothetical protein ACJ0GX_11770 [Parasynechococcus sp.]|uniref:hypothetical protein n=1 Tax=Parasynechococcus sp. TaxID=3101203 RepID=UPI0038858D52